PIPEKIELPDGRVWRNLTTPAKSKVAETLQEFRGNYQYNLLDNNLRAFNAEVPILYQWDDHEVLNNWYPQEILEDSRYSEKRVSVLAARSKQAFLEYNPVRSNGEDAQRLFRKIPYGPLLDVFIIDMRSYRGPNGANLQTTTSADTDFLGKKQVEWLKKALQASKATWKVIASDMPIGLMVYDDYVHKNTFENSSNGDGPPLGRELEMAALLRFIRRHQIQNVVWLTADVHYTAAHYYQPNRARFTDFLPFYEFVSGPLNAGTFGPGDLDNTFGPEVLFYKAPPPGQANLSPLSGMQFFGEVEIDALSKAMRVTLRDMSGASLYVKEINAQ
ncbi:MAG: alkaline phosphatase D family protein, partial [Haliscomenobacter sp.]